MKIGLHCAHEQFSPRDLLALVRQAEECGFQAAMCSDHIAPWSVRQGESGFAWSWLGAALQATAFPFGSLAIPGGWRYHPVVLAQAIATLAQMFPGRLPWVAAGSGEALNEHMVGAYWPPKAERNQRMKVGVEIMRALWRGEMVNLGEGPIRAHNARLWSLPDATPRIMGAALTVETAEWLGGWADGLITVHQPLPRLKNLIAAFHRGGGREKPLILQAHVSWAENHIKARNNAWDQWRSTALGGQAFTEFELPEMFDSASENVRVEDMDSTILVSSDPEKHIGWIGEFRTLGFDEVYIHNSGRNQREFIDMYGDFVLPRVIEG